MTPDRIFARCAWRLLPLIIAAFIVNFLDRTNGQPLIGIDETPVPQEARQNTWATQPIPKGDAFVRQCPEPDPNFALSGCKANNCSERPTTSH